MPAFTDAPVADTSAVITLAATGGKIHSIEKLQWSYSGDPTGGGIAITDDGNTIWQVDITVSGPGFIPFESGASESEVVRKRFSGGLEGTLGKEVVITLLAGGAGIFGKLNVQTRP